ncbi:uncharacterized protein Eint_050360 [Encephalitozoon intestinalis ATCC 50506]|uniref:MAGE domain-containing protein n=1 Tax=Encephalitozoon intestinalis (strain ATCC 50506) TaxID=876142 RepID=E0S757_ENCIT|nr:uncharacterized protein Eint_050360 [Encephalitozoon intestinalis ATCC 50506]ADM11485.2 hypothetical protein Eint_050360 [Encephalitozoon intestinalis ATCC 50506]UTX45197.1 melanoma-associated antigen 3-like protein [Encephalitozoon intestinalis]
MNNNEALVGEFVRMLIENHRKSVPTRKQSVRAQLKVGIKEVIVLIEASKEYLRKLGLELVGISKVEIVDPMDAEKYFIRRLEPSNDVDPHPTEEFRRLILVLTFVVLEQKSVEISRLWFLLQKTEVFESEDDFSEFLRWAKGQGYLFAVRDEERLVITLGWRYYCDFHRFDPKEYFRNNSY